MPHRRRFARWEIYRCRRGHYRRIPRMDHLRERGHPKPMFCAGCAGVVAFFKI